MAEIKTFMSDIILGQVASSDLGFSTKDVQVTWAAGATAGTAVKLVAGKYVPAIAADDADIVGIIADYQALPYYLAVNPRTAGNDYLTVVGLRGLTVNANYFVYANGNKVSPTGIAAFEAATLSKVTTKTQGHQPA